MLDNKKRVCSACKVEVAKDLSFCPLCGKYLLLEDGDKIEKTDAIYPDYDYTYINRGKWVKLIRNLFLDIAIICLLINILWKTEPYWFPYVFVCLFCVYWTVFEPFKRRNNYLRYLVRISIFSSFLLIFIDCYNYANFNTELGWSLAYAAPCVMTGFDLLIGILGLCSRKNDIMFCYGSIIMIFWSIVYFICKVLFFAELASWGTKMFLYAAFIITIILFTFKYQKVFKDIHKRIHI